MAKGDWQRGRTVPQSTRDKISNSLSGKMAGSGNPMFGRTHSEETKRKISSQSKGRRNSAETILRMSVAHKKRGSRPPLYKGVNHPMFGKPRPQEVKDKIRQSLGNKMAGTGNPRYGVKLSEETRNKISQSIIRHHASREYRASIRKKLLGRKLSATHTANISRGNKGKTRSLAFCLRQAEVRRGPLSQFWKGGITPLMTSIRASIANRMWRKEVFKRDNYTCQLCGKRGGTLEADHYPKTFASIFHRNKIRSLAEADACKEFWEVTNGRTLCYECHHPKKEKPKRHRVLLHIRQIRGVDA